MIITRFIYVFFLALHCCTSNAALPPLVLHKKTFHLPPLNLPSPPSRTAALSPTASETPPIAHKAHLRHIPPPMESVGSPATSPTSLATSSPSAPDSQPPAASTEDLAKGPSKRIQSFALPDVQRLKLHRSSEGIFMNTRLNRKFQHACRASDITYITTYVRGDEKMDEEETDVRRLNIKHAFIHNCHSFNAIRALIDNANRYMPMLFSPGDLLLKLQAVIEGAVALNTKDTKKTMRYLISMQRLSMSQVKILKRRARIDELIDLLNTMHI